MDIFDLKEGSRLICGLTYTCVYTVCVDRLVECTVSLCLKCTFTCWFVTNRQGVLVYGAVEQMKQCMQLEDKLKTMDREVSVNPQYVQKVNSCCVCLVSVVHETAHSELIIPTSTCLLLGQ